MHVPALAHIANDFKNSFLRLSVMLAALSAALIFTAPAQAQFSENYEFLEGVRERDGTVVTDLLNKPGSTIVNARDLKNGQTGLHIVVQRRDVVWLNFLLSKGANPNIADKEGLTPLMLATNLRFLEGAQVLLARKADVNQANRSGETPLIRAVQLNNIALVRLLLKAGADADRVDSLSGQSARDYAAADPRRASLLAEIEKSDDERAGKKKKAPVFGPSLR
jgi:ankyrin repeat protein